MYYALSNQALVGSDPFIQKYLKIITIIISIVIQISASYTYIKDGFEEVVVTYASLFTQLRCERSKPDHWSPPLAVRRINLVHTFLLADSHDAYKRNTPHVAHTCKRKKVCECGNAATDSWQRQSHVTLKETNKGKSSRIRKWCLRFRAKYLAN